jgi:hypothetical protein
MIDKCRLMTIALLTALPSLVAAQGHYRPAAAAPPPIPDGPTLEVPAESIVPAVAAEPLVPRPGVRQVSWLEEGADLLPAGVTSIEQMGYSTACGDGLTAASACHFDQWCQDGVFACGTTSTQFLLGPYFSGRPGPSIPKFNYVAASVRHGWMLSDPGETWLGCGNHELLCDVTAADITSGGYGTYTAGQSFLLRFNQVEPGSSLVPYYQVGAGWLVTDAYENRTQPAIGQEFNFTLQAAVGVRYFVAQNLSLDVEGGYQHISSFGLADRDRGVNAWGGRVGLTYYFPWGGQ